MKEIAMLMMASLMLGGIMIPMDANGSSVLDDKCYRPPQGGGGFGGVTLNCTFTCEALDVITVHVESKDSKAGGYATVTGEAECGGATAACAGQLECTGRSVDGEHPTASEDDVKGTCHGQSHEKWDSDLSLECTSKARDAVNPGHVSGEVLPPQWCPLSLEPSPPYPSVCFNRPPPCPVGFEATTAQTWTLPTFVSFKDCGFAIDMNAADTEDYYYLIRDLRDKLLDGGVLDPLELQEMADLLVAIVESLASGGDGGDPDKGFAFQALAVLLSKLPDHLVDDDMAAQLVENVYGSAVSEYLDAAGNDASFQKLLSSSRYVLASASGQDFNGVACSDGACEFFEPTVLNLPSGRWIAA